jgi:hypothetical protein
MGTKVKTARNFIAAALFCVLAFSATIARAADPLTSWNDAAFSNSDGDLQMLQWTAAGSGTRFCLYVHHTHAAREYAYGRTDSLARLDKGLDEAAQRGWTVVDMKNDWKRVFAFEVK